MLIEWCIYTFGILYCRFANTQKHFSLNDNPQYPQMYYLCN